jgi:hypothetical protein
MRGLRAKRLERMLSGLDLDQHDLVVFSLLVATGQELEPVPNRGLREVKAAWRHALRRLLDAAPSTLPS